MRKPIKTLQPLEGAIKTLEASIGLVTQDRTNVFNTKVGENVIDTCCAFDTNQWETGIKKEKWIIVEQYATRELAEKGHQKWVNKIKKNPNSELKDINLWNL